jgi:hypothetical protein
MSTYATVTYNSTIYEAKLSSTSPDLSKYLRDGVGFIPHRIIWEWHSEGLVEDIPLAIVLYVAYRSGQGVCLA